jgi:60 kDa SS-A/Ro ribonucleoprotein
MSASYLGSALPSRRNTPQTSRIPGKPNMVENSAGGYVFQLSPWKQLDRFLILGSEGGTYYVSERKLTKDNAKNVAQLLKTDGIRVVEQVVELSEAGRAPSNDPALFVLAMAASPDYADAATNAYALANLGRVARIGTHLFHFAAFVDELRGWGRGLRTAVANWYTDRNASQLAHQLLKYQARDGWSHRDLLRLSHPHVVDSVRNALFNWATKSKKYTVNTRLSQMPEVFEGYMRTADEKDASVVADNIVKYNLTREMIPTEALASAEVWDALLVGMPMTAMIRNLGNMSKVGLLTPLSKASRFVVSRLNDELAIQKARVHPLAILMALRTYTSGRGFKGSGSWTPVPAVVAALDDAFYLSFQNAPTTGKNIYLGIDISSSMRGATLGKSNLTAAEAAAAMAMVIAKTEPNHYIAGFASGCDSGTIWGSSDTKMMQLGITPNMRLQAALLRVQGNFGATDCALPFIDATEQKMQADTFIVLTDNETYAGTPHPMQALQQYRNRMHIPAKLVVVGMTSTGFTIADPADSGALDVVGFDTSTPSVIADFIKE